MKINEIKRLSKLNEYREFFKQLYRHSIQVLESIPDDMMKDILSKKPENSNGEYVLELVVSFSFENTIAYKEVDDFEGDMRDVDRVTMTVDVFGVEPCLIPNKDGGFHVSSYYDMEERYDFESCFDYRGLEMTLYLGKNEVEFFKLDSCEYVSIEDDTFLKALCTKSFLDNIFGNYLIYNKGELTKWGTAEPSFRVSTRFFEE